MAPRSKPKEYHDELQHKHPLKLAATAKCGRSEHLLQKAVSSVYPSPLPLHLRLLASLSALVVPSLFYLGPALLTAPLVLLVVSPQMGLWAAALIGVLVYVPVQEWPVVRQHFQLWYERYNFHHNLTDSQSSSSVEDTSLVIYSTHPHGVIPIHGYLWCALCDQLFPQRYGFGALTDIAMRLPLLRHVMGWLSSCAATKQLLVQRLNRGQNLYILPGGVSEIFLACPGRHVIKTPRRGLMKLALQTGAVLVPTYVFGANDFYDQLATYHQSNNDDKQSGDASSHPTNWVGTIQRKISSVARGGFTFFWGQYGLPLPYPVQCSMVLGDPIEPVPGTLGQGRTPSGGKRTCQRIPEPTEAQIEELQSRYTDALVRLFEQYKAQAGYPNAELVLE